MKLHRLLCFLLALALFGCSSVLPAAQPNESVKLRLAVQSDIGVDARNSLEVFLAQVQTLSEGTMVIECEETDDAAALLQGGAELALVPNGAVERSDPDFASFPSPFYFYDAAHLTAALNSAEFAKLAGSRLTQSLGAAPLAALFGGSSVFVSDESEELDMYEKWRGIPAALGEDSGLLATVMSGLGAEVSLLPDDELMEGFLRHEVHTIECKTEELSSLTPSEGEKPVCVFRSFHTARIDWLLCSATWSEALTDRQRAVLTEAAAAMLGANNTAVTAREEAAFAAIEARGIPVYEAVYDEFSDRADEILLRAQEQSEKAADEETDEETDGEPDGEQEEPLQIFALPEWDWEIHAAVRSLGLLN